MRRNNANSPLGPSDLLDSRSVTHVAGMWLTTYVSGFESRTALLFSGCREGKLYRLPFGGLQLFLGPSSHSHAVLSKQQKGWRRRFFPVSALALLLWVLVLRCRSIHRHSQ